MVMPFRQDRAPARVALIAALGCLALARSADAQLTEVMTAQLEADAVAAQSQQRVDAVLGEIGEAAARYAQLMAEADSLEKYNEQLAAQVSSQETEIASIGRQLSDIEVTNREIQPLMQQMVATLQEFVSLDVPFLLEERTRRVQTLEEMMPRADVSISEKYRRILEAYQIELEYGRTLEAYEGVLADTDRTVEFVRLGRVSLMYRTLDGQETGYWDAYAKRWVVDDQYSSAVEEALRVARKVGRPELLTVPLPSPEEV